MEDDQRMAVPAGSGPIRLLLEFCLLCRQDWLRGKDRQAIEEAIHQPHLRGLLEAAGVKELDPDEWRRFLSAKCLEDALPGFVTVQDAAKALGMSTSYVGRERSITTINVGGRVLAIAEGVERARKRRKSSEG